MVNMKVTIAGVEFNNPVVVASGTFGFGREYSEYFDLNEIGAISVKGLTLKKKDGNPPPRIAETPSGMLNSIGLQNPGVEAFIEKDLPFLKQYRPKIIANIAGNTIEDYCEMGKILSQSDVDLIEMNISCPNVKQGGVAFGTDEKTIEEITYRVKSVTYKPLIVKLSPNVTDIVKMAKAADRGGADALSLINTLFGMRIDLRTKRPVLHQNYGGLSGPCVFPVALRMIHQVKSALDLPIIGMGGVSCGNDAVEMMLAGASAVAVGTALFHDELTVVKVKEGISEYMKQEQISDVLQIIGGVKIYE